MNCRSNCAACCIAPSISSQIPGMPDGKPAGVPCIQLANDYKCKIFGEKERPAVCLALMPSEEMCGSCAKDALAYLAELEEATTPNT